MEDVLTRLRVVGLGIQTARGQGSRVRVIGALDPGGGS